MLNLAAHQEGHRRILLYWVQSSNSRAQDEAMLMGLASFFYILPWLLCSHRIKIISKPGIVVYICNLSYLEGRDRRIPDWSQLDKELLATAYLKNKSDMVVYDYNPNYSGDRREGSWFQAPAKTNLLWDQISKTNYKGKRSGAIPQVVEHLPSNCETLCSILSIANKQTPKVLT
jgi:hypothetical protein